MASSSGGLTTFVLGELLASDLVDAVIHVGRATTGHFEYQISSSAEELLSRRKSNYTSVTLAEVLQSVRDDPRRFAIVGVPCFIKAARLLAEADDTIGKRIHYYIGLVCGHLKTQFFAESLAWQAGIKPTDLGAFDFRVKTPGGLASQYSFMAKRRSTGEAVERPMSTVVDGGWGYGAFQPEACNFCDDIFAETADVALADAWLPEYTADWRGTNVVLSRSARISELLEAGVARQEVSLEPLSLDKVAASQAGNFRHRRAGLQVRLADDIDAGLSVPSKRVEASRDHADPRRIQLIRQRRSMSAASLEWFAEAKAAGDLSRYLKPMSAAIAAYRRIELPLWRRVAGACRRRLRAVLVSLRRS
jgi:coenzyme F420-reducing hydrogenase beta subunit